MKPLRRRLIIAVTAAGLVLVGLVGVGLYGLVRTPAHAPATSVVGSTTVANPSPTVGAQLNGLVHTDNPVTYARAVAQALFEWDTMSGLAAENYQSVVSEDADPSGIETSGLVNDLAVYFPTDAPVQNRRNPHHPACLHSASVGSIGRLRPEDGTTGDNCGDHRRGSVPDRELVRDTRDHLRPGIVHGLRGLPADIPALPHPADVRPEHTVEVGPPMLKVILGVVTAATVLFVPALAMIGVGLFVNPALMDAELCRASTLTVGGTIPKRLTATTAAGDAVTLDQPQLGRAATIISVGAHTTGVGTNGVLIALMAGLTESRLRMLANTTAYPYSAGYVHDGDGSDHDSLGMFQMRPTAGWGSVAQLMDPDFQAAAFYGGPAGPNHGSPRGLLDIPNWDSLSLGAAAQAVEVSAFPDRYAAFEPVARTILSALTGAAPTHGAQATESVCPVLSGTAQQLAQTLVEAHTKGTFTTLVPAMYSQEIEATANGTVTAKCQVDTRVLQMLVLVLNKFGRLGISDLGRPCVGDSLHCPSSPHCKIPDLAVDFTSVGGQVLNGAGAPDIGLLRFLDTVLPAGSWAGQSECRTMAGDAVHLDHIGQFPDTCTHQHIDIRGAGTAPLTL
jgi:hypothetical protein